VERLLEILSLSVKFKDPIDILTELECSALEERKKDRGKGKREKH